MKKNEIKVGGHYVAKVSGKLTTVRVDAIRETSAADYSWRTNNGYRYDVTNLKTGRKTTFKSAAKFRYATDRSSVEYRANRLVRFIAGGVAFNGKTARVIRLTGDHDPAKTGVAKVFLEGTENAYDVPTAWLEFVA